MGILSFIVFLALVPSIFVNNDYSIEYRLNYELEFSKDSWDPSDYINFTAPLVSTGGLGMFRIFVDDNDPSRNWSVYAQNYTWCTGSGIVSDPYVIENLFINGEGVGGMIFVKNSDQFFVIKDCWFNFSGTNESDAGVYTQFSSNGIIVNNSFTYLRRGVSITSATSDITVDNNIFISNHTVAGSGRAISIQAQSSNIVVSNNKIRDYKSPIGVTSCVNITIDKNYAENRIYEVFVGSPIFLNNINDTEITRNTLAGSFAFATFVIYNSGGSGNTITNNTVVSAEPLVFGPETSGVKTSQGSDGIISLQDCHNNLIAHNIMLGEGGSSEGGAIYGFDIFIFIGMVGLISVLLVIVKRKRL